MKKIFKKIAIALIGLAILIALTFFILLDKVDNRPYFKTQYYQKTKTRLDSTLAHLQKEQGQLYAGFAKINITPTINAQSDDPAHGAFAKIFMAGYGGRENPAQGVHDSIFARAVMLKVGNKKLVFVGADILLMPPAVADSIYNKLKNKTGLTRAQVFFGATHTHSSLGSFSAGYVGEKFSGVYQPAFVAWLSQQFIQLINEAIQDAKPAAIGTASFKAKAFIKNRMIGETGRLDDLFCFVSVVQHEGRKAILGSFNAHATTLNGSNLLLSGDYPAYWERDLEKETADLAVFFAGTVGSHSNRGKGSAFEKAKYIGEALADSVKFYLKKVIRKDTVEFTSFAQKIDIPKMQIRLTDNYHLIPYIANKLITGTHDQSIQGLKIDHLIWMTLPCELSGEYAIDLRNALALKGYRSIFTSFNGSYLGYVVPQKYYHYESYESFLMGWYGPNMGDYLMELLFTSCNAMTGEKL